MLDQFSAIRIVATFSAVLATLYALPPSSLRTPNGISGPEFVVLFMVPGLLAVLSAVLVGASRYASVVHALTFAAGVCEGVALALGLQGLLTVYQWYVDSGKPHLEPLVVMLALAAASAEACSQRIRTLLKRFRKDVQPPEQGKRAGDA